MKVLIRITIILFVLGCNESPNMGKAVNVTVKDSLGRFEGRQVQFEVIESYPDGSLKEVRYHIGDTLLIHEFWENGTNRQQTTFIDNSITEVVYSDSSGKTDKQVKTIENDSLNNFLFVTQYDHSGDTAATWYRANDTMWVGWYTEYITPDTLLKFYNGYNGIPPDSGFFYYRGEQIGYKFRGASGEWEEIIE